MSKNFEKGDRVWVRYAFDWRKGRIREKFSDGSYLVRVWGYGLKREEVEFLEKRTGGWKWTK